MHYVYSVNFQYKSPKTTYDLYAGQQFEITRDSLFRGATYTRERLICEYIRYMILMSCHCYVMFDLALVLVLTFDYLSLGLGHAFELLSLECKPEVM